MNYKLKHLSKYCCKPETPEAFELVKLSAEIGGVEFDCALVLGYHYFITSEGWRVGSKDSPSVSNRSIIPVLDFCNKLRMSEEEAEKLEDDRVSFHNDDAIKWMWSDKRMSIEIQNGFKATVNEDGTEVTLHKR